MLLNLFGYHEWATLLLLDHCEALPLDRLQESLPGTVDSIAGTFFHMVSVEDWCLRQMPAELQLPPMTSEWTLEALRPHVIAHARAWQVLLAQPETLGFTLPASRHLPAVPEAGEMLALQTIHHGELHRTGVRDALSSIGAPVPGRDSTDVWAYWFAKNDISVPA